MINSRFNTTAIEKFIANDLAEYHNLDVYISDLGIYKKHGYGQYSAQIELRHNGIEKTISVHSTDSQLFDSEDEEEKQESVLKLLSERVQDYLEELK